MRHVVDTIAAQGRDKDTELLHVTKNELAGLDALKRHFSGSGLSRNPRTGLHEAGWFDQYVAPALPAVAGLAAGALTMNPMVGAGVGAAVGAGTKAAQGGTTNDALMGGVMGGIAGYGAAGLGTGLAGGAAEAGAAGVSAAEGSQAATLASQGSEMGLSGAEQTGQILGTTNTGAGSQAATLAEQNAGMGLTQAQSNANIMSSIGSPVDASGSAVATPVATGPATSTPTNWNYLTTKPAMSDVTRMGTGTLGLMSMAPQDTSSDTGLSVNKTLPKSEVYYTPYGERRTRIVAAEGGLMSLAQGEYGDYDGAEDGVGDRRYADGGGIGFIRSMQPGGAWGNATADLYGVVDKNAPWLNQMQPGGFMGATVPGKMDYEDRQRAEEQKKQEEAAALLKAEQEQAFKDKWAQRYGNNMAAGGIANIAAAKGRYLQGPGDGMSDSIPANIDGKQEARLATGEFVVPADVVSHLGNGDSAAGAKQLHSMMDRARMARTGTKQQGKQINPRKVMPV